MTDIYRLASDQRKGPNCGPTSVSVLAGIPLAEAMRVVGEQSAKPPGWKGETFNDRYTPGIEHLPKLQRTMLHRVYDGDLFVGLNFLGLNPVVDIDINERCANLTVQNAVRSLPKDKAYLVISGGHAQAYVDGRLFDQGTGVCGDDPAKFWGRRKKVFLVITVDKRAVTKRRVIKLKITPKAKEA